MKIAYVCDRDSSSISTWSGINFFFRKALEDQNADIYVIDKLRSPRRSFLRAKKLIYMALGQKFLIDRDFGLLRDYAKQIEAKLQLGTDAIISPSSLPLAFVKSQPPKYFYTDATFELMVDYYDSFTSLCKESLKAGEKLDYLALKEMRLAFYSSDWAAQSAVTHYKASSADIRVVPFGANIQRAPSADEVIENIQRRSRDVCHLLFVGVEFMRKGGDLAFEVARILNQSRRKCILHIVGVKDLPSIYQADFVENHGFLDKRKPKEEAILNDLWVRSHFLIVPSRAECSAIAYAEANAFGLPAIARNTGGVSSMITHNQNGGLFLMEQEAKDYADFIEGYLANWEAYRQLCTQSFRTYQEKLNWKTVGKRVLNELKTSIENVPREGTKNKQHK